MAIRDFFNRRKRQQRTELSYSEDDNFFIPGESPAALRDRAQINIQELLEKSLIAWRENALARRIVNLQTQYVIGQGIQIECQDETAMDFIRAFWDHPLNHMDIRINEWCDELTRSGNLFIIFSSGLDGMTYVRAVPATSIHDIETAKNDYEQMLWIDYVENESMEYTRIEAENRISPTLDPRIMQFTVNRPVGAKWGEPDLAPVLDWLRLYSAWLEDRARLNKYRNSFLFTVQTQLKSEQERIRRQNQLNMKPLTPGSILVTTEAEKWDVINPKLESNDAAADGLAIKKQIASGVGIPLHFLAEPESQSKTSAEAAGGATYRTFEQRQKVFLWIVEEVIRTAMRRRRLVVHDFPSEAEFHLIGADIYEVDNTTLSTAAATMCNVATQLRKLGYISKDEYIRLVYKYAGEKADVSAILADGAADPLSEEEKLNLWHTENNDKQDPQKYNTTSVDSSVAHYEQGAEKFSKNLTIDQAYELFRSIYEGNTSKS